MPHGHGDIHEDSSSTEHERQKAELVESFETFEMTDLAGKTHTCVRFTATEAAVESFFSADTDTATKIEMLKQTGAEAQRKAGLPVTRWPSRLPDYVNGVRTRWVVAAAPPVRTRLVGVLRGRRRTRRVWRSATRRGPPSRSSEDDDPHEHDVVAPARLRP